MLKLTGLKIIMTYFYHVRSEAHSALAYNQHPTAEYIVSWNDPEKEIGT